MKIKLKSLNERNGVNLLLRYYIRQYKIFYLSKIRYDVLFYSSVSKIIANKQLTLLFACYFRKTFFELLKIFWFFFVMLLFILFSNSDFIIYLPLSLLYTLWNLYVLYCLPLYILNCLKEFNPNKMLQFFFQIISIKCLRCSSFCFKISKFIYVYIIYISICFNRILFYKCN